MLSTSARRLPLAAFLYSALACSPQTASATDTALAQWFDRIASNVPAVETGGRLKVTLDFARILRLEEPAKTVVIGNPGIVDGTIGDQNTLVLTGKSVGTTNLIVMGDAGRTITSLIVSVAANDNGQVSIYGGTQKKTYDCIETCASAAPAGGTSTQPQGH